MAGIVGAGAGTVKTGPRRSRPAQRRARQRATPGLRLENDNEWLPVKKVEFELLDPEAQVGVLAITGTKCP